MDIRPERPQDWRKVENLTLTDGTMFPSWTFGPISIHPDYKRKGYGLKLLQYALEKARKEKHLIPYLFRFHGFSLSSSGNGSEIQG